MLELLKIPNSEIKYTSLIDDILQKQAQALVHKKDEIIKLKLEENGVDVSDIEFLKANIQRVTVEGDPFEHYFLNFDTPNERRIVSFEIEPKVNFGQNSSGNYSINHTISLNYY